YKATFLLESGFNLTDGTQGQGRLFGRGTHIGLSGDFGEIKMGRMSVFGSAWGGVGSPFGGGWGQSGNGTVLGNGKGDFGKGGRVNNAFFYTSPRMDGWQGGVGYSLEATNGDAFATSAHDRVLTTGLRYDNGPVALALTYDRSIPNLQEPKEKNEQKEEEKKKFIRKKASSNIQIAAAYDFEMFKVHASYGNLRRSN
ncbi:porin, partial [Vibrio cholerae]|uniref:porin n=1 Tax=Vibrio cholerae TaxID=666 RepID=UPI00111311E2